MPTRTAPAKQPRADGVVLCVAVGTAAWALEALERALLGRAWIETLVLAILVGTAVRSVWTPGARWQPGIGFAAKTLLEAAIVLLGVSVSGAAVLAAGPALLAGIAAVVTLAILIGVGVGRMLGLPLRMALLVACGNAICGNSAIAAVAPVIGADGDDVAASIAFTAVLGVAVVLGLPLLGAAFGLAPVGYGALAGLTVYAVPQVLAAAAPMGPVAVQTGTLVKLVRVLMLGPVCVALSLFAADAGRGRLPRLSRLVPWFILGFVAMLLARSAGLVPAAAVTPAARIATGLTVVAMAALGLGVDIRSVARAGGRVIAAVILSLAALGGLSLLLLRLLHRL